MYDLHHRRLRYEGHNNAVLGYVSTGEGANISLWSLLGTLKFVWLYCHGYTRKDIFDLVWDILGKD
jgi:hypothetical protein